MNISPVGNLKYSPRKENSESAKQFTGAEINVENIRIHVNCDNGLSGVKGSKNYIKNNDNLRTGMIVLLRGLLKYIPINKGE